MKAIISPGKLQGYVQIPPSKSMMQRVCAGALMQKGVTSIFNPGTSNDDKAALSIIQQLGATIMDESETSIHIRSNGVKPLKDSIDCGESGLCARLFTPVAALSDTKITITGRGTLLKRPMGPFETVLPYVSVYLSEFKGKVPFKIRGPLVPNNITVDGSLSSQFLTGLLFAFAFAAKSPTTISVADLKSKSYVDLSLMVLEKFGKKVVNNNYESFDVYPSNEISQTSILIEIDWSSAAAMLVAGAIAGVSLEGVSIQPILQSYQGDKVIIDILRLANAGLIVEKGMVIKHRTFRKTTEMRSFSFDATDCPDLFPVIAILAGCCDGVSSITGLHRLIAKESNRKESICEMLTQLKVPYSISEDTLKIEGVEAFSPATINSYKDHRIVMAGAIAGLRASGPVTIKGAEAVSKSYPEFFNHLRSLGARCSFTT